jgi:hypothetical protein
MPNLEWGPCPICGRAYSIEPKQKSRFRKSTVQAVTILKERSIALSGEWCVRCTNRIAQLAAQLDLCGELAEIVFAADRLKATVRCKPKYKPTPSRSGVSIADRKAKWAAERLEKPWVKLGITRTGWQTRRRMESPEYRKKINLYQQERYRRVVAPKQKLKRRTRLKLCIRCEKPLIQPLNRRTCDGCKAEIRKTGNRRRYACRALGFKCAEVKYSKVQWGISQGRCHNHPSFEGRCVAG